jgi:hypothetical protein
MVTTHQYLTTETFYEAFELYINDIYYRYLLNLREITTSLPEENWNL